MKKVGPAAKGLGKSGSKKLDEEPQEIARALQFKKRGLEDGKKDLDDLEDQLAKLKKKFKDPNYVPTPEEKKLLDLSRDRLKKVRS